jgi:putative oxidoreductase
MLSILRIVFAALFIEHGTSKIFGFPPSGGPPMPYHVMTQFGAAGILETFGGSLLLIGLFTRPVAFLLAGEMAVAYFQQHFPHSIFPLVNRGEPAVLFCFVYLYLTLAGGGVWSIDHWIASTKRASPKNTASVRNTAPA